MLWDVSVIVLFVCIIGALLVGNYRFGRIERQFGTTAKSLQTLHILSLVNRVITAAMKDQRNEAMRLIAILESDPDVRVDLEVIDPVFFADEITRRKARGQTRPEKTDDGCRDDEQSN